MRSFVNYHRYHISNYFINYTTTGLEDLLTSGSLHGSLSAIQKWYWMAKSQMQYRSYLVSLKFLGPVLFLIFMYDLLENIRSYVHLFADDCVLYRNIYSITDCQIIQDDLSSLAQCETDWQMK